MPNSNENGVFYISKEKNNIINENVILNSEDEIIFIYDYDNLKITFEFYVQDCQKNRIKSKQFSLYTSQFLF